MANEEFGNTFGVTVEQAQGLIVKGYLDPWCCAIEGSPLYGLTSDQIAAYIAAHPELLEE